MMKTVGTSNTNTEHVQIEERFSKDPKKSHPQCFESDINMENCLLECMSPECYNEVYGGDSLEEGEVDIVRYVEKKRKIEERQIILTMSVCELN